MSGAQPAGGGFHESYHERAEVKTASDRSFGVTVGAILLLIAAWRWWGDGYALDRIGLGLVVVGGALVLLGLAAPAALAPLNWAWTRLGLLMFRVVNPVVMFLIFALSVAPIGLIRRALGHDPLRLRRDPTAASYWIERTPPGPAPASMTDQF